MKTAMERKAERIANLSEQDLLLGKKANKITGIIAAVALAVCLGIAALVFLSVPWDTRMPYSGQYSRSGIPMQMALVPIPFLLTMLLKENRKPDSSKLNKRQRSGEYVLGTIMPVVFIAGQMMFAHSILVEGGALSG